MTKSLRANKYLLSRIPIGFSGGLRNIEALCNVLGEPQKSFNSIHIIGTNGKGSTALYLANILQAHGINTGLFTSPHLVSVRERFKVNGKMISQNELDSLLLQVWEAAKIARVEPSYFETLTATAFLWFKKKQVGVAVLEAGLGGRLDSTKIANGCIAGLTSIGLDHTELLGCTKEKVLKEKLGILNKGSTLVLGNLPKELISKCPSHIKTKKISPHLQVGNHGKIYVKNAELAWAIAEKYLYDHPADVRQRVSSEWASQLSTLNSQLTRNTLKNSSWPGRMQMLFKNKKLKFILDGAHNVEAAKALARCLKEKNIPPIACIFASLTDKDTFGVLKALKPHISICYPVQIESPRARSAEEICEICKRLKIDVAKFNENIFSKSNPILITGSLYLVGKAIFKLSKEYKELAEFKGLKGFPNEGKLSTLAKPFLRPCRYSANIRSQTSLYAAK
jgi:dihydrofolate synthase/folylpolyglutamate synthase